MSRDRLAKLKTDKSSLPSWIYFKSTTYKKTNNIIHAKKWNTSRAFKDQLILIFQTNNVSRSSF